MKAVLVAVSGIQTYWHLNRKRDDEHVRALATAINRDGFDQRYPVRVVKTPDGKLHLAAGYHRLAAAAGEHIDVGGAQYERDGTLVNLPIEKVWAEVVLGDLNDVVKTMQLDNFKHDPAVTVGVGKPLSAAQKKEQCKTLLGFPDFYGKSLALLETEFGIPKRTLATWKSEVSVLIAQCADAELSDDELLNEFGFTRDRLDKMRYLVDTGEIQGADGRVTKTQASAVKKESALARAKAEFETSKSSVQNLIDEICDELFSLDRADVQRRLFSHFGISGADIADMSSEELKKERAAFSELQADLQNRKRSLWWHEFRCFHNAYQLRSELEGLGPNFEIDESVRAVERAREIDTARFESQARDARLTELESLKKFLPGVIDRENAEREKQVKAHDELKNVCELASRACSSLVKEFRERALQPDAVGQNFRAFISAALEFPKAPVGYSDTLSVAEMTNPKDLKNTGRAYAVRGVAEKLRADLTSDEPPTWMHSFLKVQNPPPPPAEDSVSGLPPSVEKPRASEPSAPELPKTGYDPSAVNLPPRPAPGNALSEKGAGAGADTRVSMQKSDNRNAEDAVGALGLGRSEMSDLETDSAVLESDLQTAADAVTAILPAGERGRGDVISHISEKVFKEKSLSTAERLAILRDLILRDLRVLQTERLTSKKK